MAPIVSGTRIKETRRKNFSQLTPKAIDKRADTQNLQGEKRP
jgi:hypothetical protein